MLYLFLIFTIIISIIVIFVSICIYKEQQKRNNYNLNQNNEKYNSFLLKLCDLYDTTKLIHVDITKNNIGLYNNEYYIFDLESVIDENNINNNSTPCFIIKDKS